jgi:hypothetical protein
MPAFFTWLPVQELRNRRSVSVSWYDTSLVPDHERDLEAVDAKVDEMDLVDEMDWPAVAAMRQCYGVIAAIFALTSGADLELGASSRNFW